MPNLQVFYDSVYHQPLLLAVPSLIWLSYLVVKRKNANPYWTYCLVVSIGSVLDAWLTANFVLGIGSLPAWAAKVMPLGFVIAGDFRVFLLLVSPSGSVSRGWWRALGLSLVVPATSMVALKLLPSSWQTESRVLFLVYELLFLFFLGTLYGLYLRPRATPVHRPWLDHLATFALGYYTLWSLADIWLLLSHSQADTAWGVRIVANLLYYVGWSPWVYFLASRKSARATT